MDTCMLVHSLTYSNEMGSIDKSTSIPTAAAYSRLTYQHTFKHIDDLKIFASCIAAQILMSLYLLL